MSNLAKSATETRAKDEITEEVGGSIDDNQKIGEIHEVNQHLTELKHFRYLFACRAFHTFLHSPMNS